ncbi:MAG: peptidylprolyl isomerase [Verrucomicrobiales bacterium]|nr:peptidylprolyl isomerase [Verrucomicrobiales bacterium]
MRRRVLLAAICALAVPVSGQENTELVNGISVIVNDQVITRDDVLRYVSPAVELLVRQYRDRPALLNDRIRQAERDGLNQLIERKLILHEFETAGYALPDSVIEEEIERRIKQKFGGDRVSLTQTLRSEGTTRDAWRQKVREEYIISAMRSKHISESTIISPYRIEKYYVDNLDKFKLGDQVKLRTIMISAQEKAAPSLPKILAQEIITKLDEGSSFADLAMIYSEDTYRTQGGDRGWVERSNLRDELAAAAFGLKAGEHSGVIELDGTAWVIQVEAVRKDHVRTLPEVRDEIQATLVAQEQARQHEEWINRLKAKSYVQYY